MSDGKSKVQIPAWQRAQATKPAPADDPVYSQPQGDESESTNDATTKLEDVMSEPPAQETSTSDDKSEAVPAADDPVYSQPQAEEESAQGQQYVFQADDFDHFKAQQQKTSEAAPAPPKAPAPQERPPPIITYPEFLVEAHKPPPLVTPGRVINAVYAASGIAAVLYGASRWIINPMVDSLSESRHDFLGHTNTKMTEFNDRLAKIASKIPEPKPEKADDDEDEESDTSDPTELYHRDMGTQTDNVPTPKSPLAVSDEEKRDLVTHAENTLKIMKEHLNELADGSDKAGESHKDRMEGVNNLRHYLDGLLYGAAGIPSYLSADDMMATKSQNGSTSPKEDPIEDLKKEIRGVKGVLLSAKRFPAVSRPIAGTA